MKLVIEYYDKLQHRPMYKFFLNLFALKSIYYFSIKHLMYIQIFYKIKKFFTVKLFKFTYSFYNLFVTSFIIVNICCQISLLLLINDFNNEM